MKKMPNIELSEAAIEARRAYKRAWNARNKDKVKAAQRRFWEKKALEMEAAAKEQEAADAE
jgi:hypothetical protein